MIKRKGIFALACAMTIVGGMASATPVHAAEKSGTTPVSYDNRNIVDVEGNGVWGVAIPTAITFTDDLQTSKADIELVGLNGYDLSDFASIDVDGTVKSTNSYNLVGEGSAAGSTASYTYELNGNAAFTADANEQAIDKLTLADSKQEGTATLVNKGTKKGQHKDTLTFKFTGTSALK
ncbi:hypothetical protein [Clostridium perfringens]|uniref:hypothetical protein n=1 Tax=Clostridium perfringens TaxID=1502 RepID=UPI0024BCAE0E|nr:hypothetical protein [Clostridium perfringens]